MKPVNNENPFFPSVLYRQAQAWLKLRFAAHVHRHHACSSHDPGLPAALATCTVEQATAATSCVLGDTAPSGASITTWDVCNYVSTYIACYPDDCCATAVENALKQNPATSACTVSCPGTSTTTSQIGTTSMTTTTGQIETTAGSSSLFAFSAPTMVAMVMWVR